MQTNRQFSAATPRSFWRWISTIALLVAVAAHAGLTKETIGKHTCYVYVPEKLSTPAPLLMLFHGSGRDGMSQINEWRKLADKEGIVLAAPNSTDTRYWNIPDDGPELLRDIAAFLGKQRPIDQRRIYAFGHSAGAVFMLNMAPLESDLFAAVAVHAGQFANAAASGMLRFAERKIPIFIVVGTKDPYFSVAFVRETKAAFATEGIPVETREIEGHDHNYYRRSAEINDMVWKFLSPKRLDSDAHYSNYTITKSGEAVSILPADQ